MNQHKTTTKRSLKYTDTVEATCTCGWFASLGKHNVLTNSLQVVRRELGYLVQDHLDETSGN